MSVRFVVTGRVQGVGFRWFVAKRARALGVAGFVRNRDDGSVEVVADGAAPAVEELAAALQRGPAAAHVVGVSRSEATEKLPADRFDVR
jgi:acylphosphatase